MNSRVAGACALAIVLLVGMAAFAATITVTTGQDPIDVPWQTATVADLPGPDGKVSFSEAMIASSNTPGHDVIAFEIPESEWQMQWLYPGYAVIQSSYTYFWRTPDGVTLDGTTQEAFTGDRNPGDAELVFYGGEIYLNGDGSTLMGVHGGAVSLTGSGNLATGNTGGINLTLYGGSGTEVRDNVCGTIKIDRSSNNLVVGNVASRVRVLGAVGLGQPAVGNVIGGAAPDDRNFITGYGYVNSEGLPAGAAIQLADAFDTTIRNNWIGTTTDGLAQGNLACTVGVSFEGENHDTTIQDNLISGILGRGQGPHHAGQLFGRGIMVSGSGSGVLIADNDIGLDANGDPLLGSVTGIDVGTWNFADVSNIVISGNRIAGHRLNGLVVGASVPQARLARNAIHSNGAIGIDLIPTGYGSGVSPNDPLDADTGGNGVQNFPVVGEALFSGSTVQVSGTLESYPGEDFTVEFFASPACDLSGFGQALVYLGEQAVTTDAAGNAAFDALLAATVSEGWVVSATATREPLGATSEYAACVTFVESQGLATAAPTAAAARPGLGLPWPNPSNPVVNVELVMPEAGQALVQVFDVRGRLVTTLVDGEVEAGSRNLRWNGTDRTGSVVASGVYFVRLAGSPDPARRFALVR